MLCVHMTYHKLLRSLLIKLLMMLGILIAFKPGPNIVCVNTDEQGLLQLHIAQELSPPVFDILLEIG